MANTAQSAAKKRTMKVGATRARPTKPSGPGQRGASAVAAPNPAAGPRAAYAAPVSSPYGNYNGSLRNYYNAVVGGPYPGQRPPM